MTRGCSTLFAVVAPAVPAIAVEEALWTAWDVVEGSAELRADRLAAVKSRSSLCGLRRPWLA